MIRTDGLIWHAAHTTPGDWKVFSRTTPIHHRCNRDTPPVELTPPAEAATGVLVVITHQPCGQSIQVVFSE